MSPAALLLLLPMRRMPIGGALVALLYAIGCALAVWGPRMPAARVTALVTLVGFAGWFWNAMAGMTLRGLCRPETLLLPDFRRQLAVAGALNAAIWIGIPALLIALLGGHALHLGALLLVIAAMGLSAGCGSRVTLLVWLAFVGAGWMPALTYSVWQKMYLSPLTPLLALLIAGVLLSLSLRPLLTISDREVDESPLQAAADGRTPPLAADGTLKRSGPLARFLAALYDGSAQRALQRALERFRRRPDAPRRIALLRALLLPHDNPRAVALRLVMICAFVSLYLFITRGSRTLDAGFVGAYAVLIAIGRFTAVGQGMLRMRPNLADLYFTLAPPSRAAFQEMLADALLVLIAVTTVTAVGLAAIAALVLHAAAPLRLILAAAITAVGAAFTALAVHLVGPESRSGRALVQIGVVLGAMLAYALTYWLLGRFGMAVGGVVATVLDLGFGIGFWQSARRDFIRMAPRFDAPLT